ncbi:UNVERIFIED_CONTAM: hypothetical protein Sindi_0139300 [Sesamum indicum]
MKQLRELSVKPDDLIQLFKAASPFRHYILDCFYIKSLQEFPQTLQRVLLFKTLLNEALKGTPGFSWKKEEKGYLEITALAVCT